MPSAHAILIADDFSYAGTNGLAASHLLATDFQNYPVFETVGVLNIYEGREYATAPATLLNNEWSIINAIQISSLINIPSGQIHLNHRTLPPKDGRRLVSA